MFNVTRTQPGPDCSKDYRSVAVVNELRKIFYGKCYLCENEVSEPVVEHFVPHKGKDDSKKYDWNNLYYACNRCNSIKGDFNDELMDCCDSSVDMSKSIKCQCPAIPNDDIVVESQSNEIKTENTAKLLNRCYNEDNTGIRGISKEILHEKLFEYFAKFINFRIIIKNKDSSQNEKEKAIGHIESMTQDNYPFSIFWKWHVWSDPVLNGVIKTTGVTSNPCRKEYCIC